MTEFYKFIEKFKDKDPLQLRLKYHNTVDYSFDVDFAIEQIECRNKYKNKFSDTLSRYPKWIFPDKLSCEQATSDLLAFYHASIVRDNCNVADLTAGLGIDVLHLSKKTVRLTAVEIVREKADTLAANLDNAEIKNVEVLCSDCRDIIEEWINKIDADDNKLFDVVFIDPARRGIDGSRLYNISDCQPDIIALLPKLKKVCNKVIVKLSPMLDIKQALRLLPNIVQVHIIGTATECKEVLCVIDFDAEKKVEIKAVTLSGNKTDIFSFYLSDEDKSVIDCWHNILSNNPVYLYEPWPSVMKAAPFALLTNIFQVKALHNNTHIYVSNSYISDFPGSALKIDKVIPFESKHIKRIKKEYSRLLVTTRNFDIPAQKLREKLGVKDGGEKRLFAVRTTGNLRVMILADNIQH